VGPRTVLGDVENRKILTFTPMLMFVIADLQTVHHIYVWVLYIVQVSLVPKHGL
jgi:hypothetical protein